MSELLQKIEEMIVWYQGKVEHFNTMYPGEPIMLEYVINADCVPSYDSDQTQNAVEALKELIKNAVEAHTGIRNHSLKRAIRGDLRQEHIEMMQDMLTPGRIAVQVDGSAYSLDIRIADEGMGLPPGYEHRDYADWRSKKVAFIPKFGGFGVKLANKYIGALGGSLTYRRREQGTEATIILPIT